MSAEEKKWFIVVSWGRYGQFSSNDVYGPYILWEARAVLTANGWRAYSDTVFKKNFFQDDSVMHASIVDPRDPKEFIL